MSSLSGCSGNFKIFLLFTVSKFPLRASADNAVKPESKQDAPSEPSSEVVTEETPANGGEE